MTPIALALALLLADAPIPSAPPAPVPTLRVDYAHSGTAKDERFALERIAVEGPWPGNPDRPLDDVGSGLYRLQVKDAKTQAVLYSRGFASIFGEWQTTDEAKQRERAFSESARFPLPAAPVVVVLQKRQDAVFKDVWSVPVDPADPLIDHTPPAGKPWAVIQNGDPAHKVDLLLLGDGYTAAEMGKWHADAKRLADILFATSPFKERKTDFNVWALDTPSDESGISRPSTGIHRHSALRATYDAFGSERYVLAFDNQRLREAAAAAPYDFVEVVVNGVTYGGGGIHSLYATVSADNAFSPYVFVHEFGHHFAALADEYYTSPVETETPQGHTEPWEPNVTADPHAAKWADLVTRGLPLPTPWAKDEFETIEREIQGRRKQIRAERKPESVMEDLFREEMARTQPLLARTPGVGAFEGANYEAKGYYRPQADCIMFSRDPVGFCAVCRRAIDRVIDLYTKGQ